MMKKKTIFAITVAGLALSCGCSRQKIQDAPENPSEGEAAEEVTSVEKDAASSPNYYHPLSDSDGDVIYFGGAGRIYKATLESEVHSIYCTPHIAGAALYGDYIFSLAYHVTDDGMTADLIRLNKNGLNKEVLTQVDPGSYDLRIVESTLVVSEDILTDYGPVREFQAYTLDSEGNLLSDMPQGTYERFGPPEESDEGLRYLIDPWFSTEYYGYTCLIKPEGVIDINSIWIKESNEESAEEILTCRGEPLIAKDIIFYCDSERETPALMQYFLKDATERELYKIPGDYKPRLFTYDDEWVYFLQEPNVEERGGLSSFLTRVNLQDGQIENIRELSEDESISNFNVYDSYCYFILKSAESSGEWEILGLDSTSAAEAEAPSKEEILAMREQVLEGMSEEEIERLKENIKVANQQMESAYLDDNLFEKLEDTEHLYWNYFDQKGDIQIKEYGDSITVYNRFDAENFAALLEEMKESVHNEKLRDDLQKLIDETLLASETHEVEHVVTIYQMLHDMDYYLLRYGLEDVGKYVQDISTIAKYYGVLSVYE
ncbi:MAG: DUF5050 domain-containing protein [Ruminococcus sp.]|nr:DUF5050 domain-containing protein [Ruminococcus sp.]